MATKKRSGLGRGIGALIPQSPSDVARPVDVFFPSNQVPTNSAAAKADPNAEQVDVGEDAEHALRPVPGATLMHLSPLDIVPNRAQPRTEFDEEALAELTHSVREFGVLQPIVVREIEPAPAKGEPRFELIMGERRLRASKRAGLDEIPAIVRSTADEDMLRDALLENLHRAQLNPLEEASAYQQLLADFGITQEQLAQRIGRSRPQITNTIRLLQLPEAIQSRVAAGVLSAGHARAILALTGDETAMSQLADKIVNEGLSVRAAEAVASDTRPKRPKPRPGGRLGQLAEIGERLGDRLDTRVKVNLSAKKGTVVIEFSTIQDLNRILHELGDPGFG